MESPKTHHHPDHPEHRTLQALEALQIDGAVVHLEGIEDGVARISLDPGAGDWDGICRRITGALAEAAPDLKDVVIYRAILPGSAWSGAS